MDILAALPGGVHEIQAEMACELEAGHPGPHYALAQGYAARPEFPGVSCRSRWVRWNDGADHDWLDIEDSAHCWTDGPSLEEVPDENDVCRLPGGHEGCHTFEYGVLPSAPGSPGLPVSATKVPYMASDAIDLGQLAASVTEFAAAHNMTLVPAIPGAGSGQVVVVEPEDLDLPGFLELARKLGDGAFYLSLEPFSADDDQSGDMPAQMARRKGQICELRLAFASAGHGLLHFWGETAPWYLEWLGSQDGLRKEADEDTQVSDEERERLTAELADAILSDQEFRASPPMARRRRSQLLAEQLPVPEGARRWIRWDAAQQARDQADDLVAEAYRPVLEQIDSIAAEFLASRGWQQNASAGLRKKAAEQFLIPRADGFFPSAALRDELYTRAKELSKAKDPKADDSGLF